MLSANSQSSASFQYVGNLLNATYLTGFVREPFEGGFFLQQTNNIHHAIPIHFEGKMRRFREMEPITVICHAYGEKNAEGQASMRLKCIGVETPTLLTMPEELVWNNPRNFGDGKLDENFKPFAKNPTGAMELSDEIKTQLANDVSEDNMVKEILEAGNSDRTLGSASNVIKIAGFIQAFAMARDKNNAEQNDCLTLLVRQHKDEKLSIPVRIYGRFAKAYMNKITIGMPVRIDGQVRVNAKPVEVEGVVTGMTSFVYLHSAHIRTADKSVSIKSIPTWYNEMRENILKSVRARQEVKSEAKPALLTETKASSEL